MSKTSADVTRTVVRGVAVFETEVVVLDLEVKERQNELLADTHTTHALSVDCADTHTHTCSNAQAGRTFSRMSFQMMRVISSPSSSTTGLSTLIFWNVLIVAGGGGGGGSSSGGSSGGRRRREGGGDVSERWRIA